LGLERHRASLDFAVVSKVAAMNGQGDRAVFSVDDILEFHQMRPRHYSVVKLRKIQQSLEGSVPGW